MSHQLQTYQVRLAEARQELLTLLQSLTPEQWQTTVFSDADWTVNTLVAHLIESERGMSIQIHKTRKGEETVPEDFDLDRWNAGVRKRMGELSTEQLFEQLDKTRARTLEGMATLTDAEWALTGRHPGEGMVTIEQYYQIMADHERLHMQHIRDAVGLH